MRCRRARGSLARTSPSLKPRYPVGLLLLRLAVRGSTRDGGYYRNAAPEVVSGDERPRGDSRRRAQHIRRRFVYAAATEAEHTFARRQPRVPRSVTADVNAATMQRSRRPGSNSSWCVMMESTAPSCPLQVPTACTSADRSRRGGHGRFRRRGRPLVRRRPSGRDCTSVGYGYGALVAGPTFCARSTARRGAQLCVGSRTARRVVRGPWQPPAGLGSAVSDASSGSRVASHRGRVPGERAVPVCTN